MASKDYVVCPNKVSVIPDAAMLKAVPRHPASGPTSSKSKAKFLLPPCRVCGDQAAGFHYGANTCEACKGFFHRSLRRKGEYKCLGAGQSCDVKPGKQRSCPKCRYQRCLEAGMSRSAIKTGRYTYVKRNQDALEVQRLEILAKQTQAFDYPSPPHGDVGDRTVNTPHTRPNTQMTADFPLSKTVLPPHHLAPDPRENSNMPVFLDTLTLLDVKEQTPGAKTGFDERTSTFLNENNNCVTSMELSSPSSTTSSSSSSSLSSKSSTDIGGSERMSSSVDTIEMLDFLDLTDNTISHVAPISFLWETKESAKQECQKLTSPGLPENNTWIKTDNSLKCSTTSLNPPWQYYEYTGIDSKLSYENLSDFPLQNSQRSDRMKIELRPFIKTEKNVEDDLNGNICRTGPEAFVMNDHKNNNDVVLTRDLQSKKTSKAQELQPARGPSAHEDTPAVSYQHLNNNTAHNFLSFPPYQPETSFRIPTDGLWNSSSSNSSSNNNNNFYSSDRQGQSHQFLPSFLSNSFQFGDRDKRSPDASLCNDNAGQFRESECSNFLSKPVVYAEKSCAPLDSFTPQPSLIGNGDDAACSTKSYSTPQAKELLKTQEYENMDRNTVCHRSGRDISKANSDQCSRFQNYKPSSAMSSHSFLPSPSSSPITKIPNTGLSPLIGPEVTSTRVIDSTVAMESPTSTEPFVSSSNSVASNVITVLDELYRCKETVLDDLIQSHNDHVLDLNVHFADQVGKLNVHWIKVERGSLHDLGARAEGRGRPRLAEWLERSVRGQVYFARAIPGFSALPMDDRMALIKFGRLDFTILTLAQANLPWDNFQEYELIAHGAQRDLAARSFCRLCSKMQKLALGIEEMVLIKALVILASDRSLLGEDQLVNEMAQNLTACLFYVLEGGHSKPSLVFGRIMSVLTEVRTITENFVQELKSAGFKPTGLHSALLREMYSGLL